MENQKPKISVLLPVHNGEDYISFAIESVLNQSFKDFELVIVNDESTDNTKSIIEKYSEKDNKIVLINLKKQQSLADVLNIGISNCKGEYIARLDHDDEMYPGRLESQFEFMKKNPKVVVCGGQVDLIDESGKVTGERRYPLDNKDLKRNIFLVSPFAHPAVLMKKESLKKVGGYNLGLKKVEDIMLWFKLAKEGEFANVEEKVLKYRIRKGSESLNDMQKHFEITYNLRKKVIRENIYTIDLRQRILLEIQWIIVNIMKIFPKNWFIKVFEIGRKVLQK